jgi:formate-dependent nitrite reductase cytochrome c552 subunit
MNKKLAFFVTFIILVTTHLHADNFEEFKSTCADIGFKQNTEAFGDCVLELVARSKKLELKKAEQLAIEKQLETERRKENEIAELRHEQQLADQRRQYEMERQQEANENRELIHAIIGGASNLANTLSSPPAQSYQPSRINCNTNPGIGGSTSSYSTTCTAY